MFYSEQNQKIFEAIKRCYDNKVPIDITTVMDELEKKKISDKLDHQNLNEVLPFNPTAENIARWIVERVPCCYKAKVQESEGNTAIYEV